jgi:hypothetical protein
VALVTLPPNIVAEFMVVLFSPVATSLDVMSLADVIDVC